MTRATLTVLNDGQRRLHRLKRGDVVELSAVDRNVVDGADDSLVEFHRSGRRGFDLWTRNGGWDIGGAAYDGVVVDGVELEHHSRRLRHGDEIFVDGALFRFDEVTAPPLSRLVAGPGVVLYDVASVAGAVRAFGKNDAGVDVLAVVVWSPQRERRVWRLHRDIPRGVGLLDLRARAGSLDVAVSLDAIARLSQHLIDANGEWFTDDNGVEHVDGVVGWDFARCPPWLGWNGALCTLPALWPTSVDTTLMALKWWLAALVGRDTPPEAQPLLEATSPSSFHALALQARDRQRAVDPNELVAIAQGLLPDERRREQELADELVIVEAAGVDVLRARAMGRRP